MLVQKLLRIDEGIVQEIEKLVSKSSKKEYVSFSSMVRKLLERGIRSLAKNCEYNSSRKLFDTRYYNDTAVQPFKIMVNTFGDAKKDSPKDRNIAITQCEQTVVLTPEVLQTIINWYHDDEDLF